MNKYNWRYDQTQEYIVPALLARLPSVVHIYLFHKVYKQDIDSRASAEFELISIKHSTNAMAGIVRRNILQYCPINQRPRVKIRKRKQLQRVSRSARPTGISLTRLKEYLIGSRVLINAGGRWQQHLWRLGKPLLTNKLPPPIIHWATSEENKHRPTLPTCLLI